MMRFLPKEICHKLVDMGCESFCNRFWMGDFLVSPKPPEWSVNPDMTVSAFCLEDFVGTHEQAKENAKKVFGTGPLEIFSPDISRVFEWDRNEYHRHQLIDSDDWIEFLTNYLKGEDDGVLEV